MAAIQSPKLGLLPKVARPERAWHSAFNLNCLTLPATLAFDADNVLVELSTKTIRHQKISRNFAKLTGIPSGSFAQLQWI